MSDDGVSQKTNLRLLGRITHDIEARNAAKTGRLVINFSVAYHRSQGSEPVYIDCVCLDSETSQFILDNFKKGEMIQILNASPSNKKTRDGKNKLQFAVWNVLVPFTNRSSQGGSDEEIDSDEPPY